MSNRVAEQPGTSPQTLTLLDLAGYINVREGVFPPHVVESLRVRFPDMANAIEALMNTAEMMLYFMEMPVSMVRQPNTDPVAITVHSPTTVYIGPDLPFIMCQVLYHDAGWAALRAATHNFTKMPDIPVDLAKAYGVESRPITPPPSESL